MIPIVFSWSSNSADVSCSSVEGQLLEASDGEQQSFLGLKEEMVRRF